ncbi:MAG: anhydro-N-acetylmuramic acid kinase [Limnohabitans sp.]|nr:anhydro-N-acetylmuramic acid kinase [Limnohabitans sp.]
MNTQKYNVVGVMSGTSLDGVDLAHIIFTVEDGKWNFEILESETVAYTEDWVNKLKNAVNYSEKELITLNEDYTVELSTIISNFIERNNLSNIDAVCSHGHTILHQPQNGFTLQIGNLPKISKLIHQKVVCDFRVQDVQLGGQGAPLVPIGDRILFSEFDYCLNLGGFSNISFEEDTRRIAFDISPVNTVLNFYANKLGLQYDEDGNKASGGEICEDLLVELNELEFYKKAYPKSLGIECVNAVVLPIIEKYPIAIEDKLRTFVEHISTQIYLILTKKEGRILITGGGAYNKFLIATLRQKLSNIEIIVPDKKIIEFKEALIFALLGVLKLRNEINVLSSVTGSKRDHSSGIIFN